MKTLFLCLALVATAANADTVTLYPSGCAATRICTSVANNAELSIALYAPSYATPVSLIVNGVFYSAPTGSSANIVNLLLTEPTGNTVTLNATFTSTRHLNRSGHNYWVTTWTLTGGTVDGLLLPAALSAAVSDGTCRGCH